MFGFSLFSQQPAPQTTTTMMNPQLKDMEDKAADSKKRMQSILRTIDETAQMGQETLVVLNEQGERIRKVQDQVDYIQDNMDRADQTIHKIDSVSYSMYRHFVPEERKPPRNTNAKLDEKLQNKGSNSVPASPAPSASSSFFSFFSSSPPKTPTTTPVPKNTTPLQYSYATSLPQEEVMTQKTRKDLHETDVMIDDALEGVKKLKGLAIQYGQALDEHNGRLDTLSVGVVRADARVRSANKKVDKILR
eukprot:TRINITY_DN3248_c0_g1_i1.p1 TRINITY_DN3248_c0_g1~~TRINITY_DN3248_c0_g1_i1.p1  ORF type:complete len:248 (-),score=90.28 TRINITY_DN3248_c0_g1_i1:141-884(-)